ncbi:MAG: PD40 domain-containing protein, partial [Alistipes sp.]|nr:PD40 domain-containing protein [Alistipes sp.]
MKKLLLFMAFLSCLAGCEQRPQPLEIDNSLTAEEISAAKFTPEVMWKMGRIGAATLSPDGSYLLYTVTYYSMEENRGVTAIYLRDMTSGAVRQLTDHASNNHNPKWSATGKHIYFLSDRSGSSQIWSMTPQGEDLKQVSAFEKDVEAFGVSPCGDKLFYVQRVQVCDRKSSDVHK